MPAILLAMPLVGQPQAVRNYPVRPVPFTAVHVTDQFWAPKIETNRKVTIPFAFQKDEETGRIDNFIRAAKALKGEPFENHKYPPYPFDDTDARSSKALRSRSVCTRIRNSRPMSMA